MLMLAAWVHDLSPFAVRFSGDFGVRWYGLSYILGFVYGWGVMTWLAKRRLIALPVHRVTDAMLWLVIAVIVGGRLGYVLLYEPSLLMHFDNALPFWGVLQMNRGGMAFHGGLVGVMLACWRISRGFRRPDGSIEGRAELLHIWDVLAIACTVGLGLGRIANFINGELLGKIIAAPGQAAPWWSVRFPQELLMPMTADQAHRPRLTSGQLQQLDEVVARHVPGLGLSEEGVARLIDQLQSGGSRGARAISQELAPLLAARHPSQLYQAFLEGVVLTALIWWVWMKPRATGVLAGTFLIGYGALRVVAEFYRLPDAHLAVARPLGLSRGQWFSAAMVLMGLGVLLHARRTIGTRWGGWAVRTQKA
jgi:phosphatidylglycerol---prolipoprotein diacylglyceryl transferase